MVDVFHPFIFISIFYNTQYSSNNWKKVVVNWHTIEGLTDYTYAINEMEDVVNGIINGTQNDTIWLLEHPPIYTVGSSAEEGDLLDVSNEFPIYNAGRGGKHTYHGPGQRVIYLMLSIKKIFNQPDLKKYVYMLEELVIRSLKRFGINSLRREGRVGIWVVGNGTESKIASIGIRVRKWVAYHGIAVNINPDLSHFNAIVPCGIKEFGVTSMSAQGKNISLEDFDIVFKEEFKKLFYNHDD